MTSYLTIGVIIIIILDVNFRVVIWNRDWRFSARSKQILTECLSPPLHYIYIYICTYISQLIIIRHWIHTETYTVYIYVKEGRSSKTNLNQWSCQQQYDKCSDLINIVIYYVYRSFLMRTVAKNGFTIFFHGILRLQSA